MSVSIWSWLTLRQAGVLGT